jgi:hypothetical protein
LLIVAISVILGFANLTQPTAQELEDIWGDSMEVNQLFCLFSKLQLTRKIVIYPFKRNLKNE